MVDAFNLCFVLARAFYDEKSVREISKSILVSNSNNVFNVAKTLVCYQRQKIDGKCTVLPRGEERSR